MTRAVRIGAKVIKVHIPTIDQKPFLELRDLSGTQLELVLKSERQTLTRKCSELN